MSDSDSESYEVIDKRFSPSVRNFPEKRRAQTQISSFSESRKHSARSSVPNDIDFRPPYPTPKSHALRSVQNGSILTYDQITVSPVAPDYQMTSSCSPPRQMSSPNAATPPPLPPMNPGQKKRIHGRSNSDSMDHLSQTPPRSNQGYYAAPTNNTYFSNGTAAPNGITSNGTTSSNGRSPRASTNSVDSDGGHSASINPTYNRQTSTTSAKYQAGSVDSLPSSFHNSYVRDSKEMSLAKFTERYKKLLPLQVVVTKGYYGADERTSISEGDMFNIHFFKQTKVVKMVDTNNYTYTVPLNSSLEFGMVYQLPDGFKQSDCKYHFKTVSDILQLKTLPKVVRAMKSFKGSNPESSVEQHDLLMIQEVKVKRGIKSSKILKCVEANSGAKKSLNEDCAGCFSVRPQDVRLFLPEIVKFITLPQAAILSYGGGGRLDLPPHLISSQVTIKTMEFDESIVATSILEEDHRPINQYENTPSLPLVDIPIDLDIEVAIIKLAEKDTDQLYFETRTLLEKYNPSMASYLNIDNSVTASAQSTLFKAIRQDQNQKIGIEILQPENAFKMSDIKRLSNSSDSSRRQLGTPSECANAEEVNGRLDSLENTWTMLETRLNKFELKLQTVDGGRPDYEGLKKEVMSVKSDVYKIRRDCDDFKKSIEDITNAVSKLTSSAEKLSRHVELLKKLQLDKENEKPAGNYIAMFPAGDIRGGTNGVNTAELEVKNKENLLSMDTEQVCQLLEIMKLSVYVENFRREQINGEILAELNEDALKDELGISSKIHRVKLLKIINGRHSAVNVLNGENPYYVHLAQSNS